MILAALSNFRNKPHPSDLVVFGEIGLAGEIRPVPNGEERLKEAAKHGYKRAIIPKGNMPQKPIKGMKIMTAQRLEDALDYLQKGLKDTTIFWGSNTVQ